MEGKRVNKVRVKLVGSSEKGRERASEARVKTRASFLKYDVLKSTQLRILLLVLFFGFWGKITGEGSKEVTVVYFVFSTRT